MGAHTQRQTVKTLEIVSAKGYRGSWELVDVCLGTCETLGRILATIDQELDS